MLSAQQQAAKSAALPYTHFVSLPLAVHPQLVKKVIKFRHSILGIHDANSGEVSGSSSRRDTTAEKDGSQKLHNARQVAASAASASKPKISTLSELGIDESLFIKPETLHLTLIMLKLWDKERVDAAVKIFKDIAAEVMNALDGRPVSIRLKGLDCMQGYLAKARVLYAPVEVVGGADRLLKARKVIIDALTEAGLVLEKDAKHALKLHATLMNTSLRRRGKYVSGFETFDGRGVVERFGSEDWGEYLTHEVHLSQRFKFDEDGYYHCCASIPLPQKKQK